jgi:hypothetical protein
MLKYLLIALGAMLAVFVLLFVWSAMFDAYFLSTAALLIVCPLILIVFSVMDILKNRRFWFVFAFLPPLGALVWAVLTDNGAWDSNPDSSAIAWTLFFLAYVYAAYLALYSGLYVTSVIVRHRRKDKRRFQPV